MSTAKSHPIFQERKPYETSRLIHRNLADVDAFGSRRCLLPTNSPSSSHDGSPSMPNSLKRLSMKTTVKKKKEQKGNGEEAGGKREEQVLSCFLDPTRVGVTGELTAVSFVTIKVEVPMFGSLTIVSVIRGVDLMTFSYKISPTLPYTQ